MKRRSTYWISAVIVSISIVGLCMLNAGRTDAVNQSAAAALTQSPTEVGIEGLSGLDDSVLPAIGKMTAALVIVIFAIYLGVWLLRRFTGRRGNNNQRLLEVLETAYLGSKKSVALLRVADKSVLIGVTESGMSVLTELDADQTAVALSGPEKEALEGDDFDRLFSSAAKRLQRFAGRERPVTQVS